MHGIDFSQMPPQCPSGAHLNSANGVNVSCDLNGIQMREIKTKQKVRYLHKTDR